MKYIFRILVLPFGIGIMALKCIFTIAQNSYLFILHGGEWAVYDKGEKSAIMEMISKIKAPALRDLKWEEVHRLLGICIYDLGRLPFDAINGDFLVKHILNHEPFTDEQVEIFRNILMEAQHLQASEGV